MTAFCAGLMAAFVLVLPGTSSAADLSKIDRSIGNQPKYETKPGYCLLVFGPEADTRIWLVRDGDFIYLDRNGNGDLTDEGERLNGKGIRSPVTITDAVGQKKYHMRQCNLTTLGNGKEQEQYCHISIDTEDVYRQYSFVGFADRPQDAPIVHFDGPLTLEVADRNTVLVRGDPPSDFSVYMLTRGHGNRLGSTVLVDYNLGVPEDACPVVEVEFPSKESGSDPIRAKYTLKQRC
jgi:hypothetical protein